MESQQTKDSQKLADNNLFAYNELREQLEILARSLPSEQEPEINNDMDCGDTVSNTESPLSSIIFTPLNKRKADDAELTNEDHKIKKIKTNHKKN